MILAVEAWRKDLDFDKRLELLNQCIIAEDHEIRLVVCQLYFICNRHTKHIRRNLKRSANRNALDKDTNSEKIFSLNR